MEARADGADVEDVRISNGHLAADHIEGKLEDLPLVFGANTLQQDALQIGPYVLALRGEQVGQLSETDQVIRLRVEAQPSNKTLFGQNAAYKLQVVLEIAQRLENLAPWADRWPALALTG